MIRVNITSKDCNKEDKYFPLTAFGKVKWCMFGLNSVIECDDVMCNGHWTKYECKPCILNDKNVVCLRDLYDNNNMIIEAE